MRTPEEDDDDVSLDNVRALRATERALLCLIDGAEVWIPQSQISDDSEVWEAGQSGRLIITAWLARRKGFAV